MTPRPHEPASRYPHGLLIACAAVGLALVVVAVWPDARHPGSASASSAGETAAAPAPSQTPPARRWSTEELADLVPSEHASVVSSHPPTGSEPIVVLIQSVHINEGPAPPSNDPSSPFPHYTSDKKRELGAVIHHVFGVASRLIDAGVTSVGAEGIYEPVRHDELHFASMIFPDLKRILSLPPDQRRAETAAALRAGSNLDISFALVAAHGPAIHVVGVEPAEVVHRMHGLSDRLVVVERRLHSPAWAQLRADVLGGSASAQQLAQYDAMREESQSVVQAFCDEAVKGRDIVMADGAIELARSRAAGAILLPMGGFHTDGVIERLQDRGAGYVLVRPHGFGDTAPTFAAWKKGLADAMPPSR